MRKLLEKLRAAVRYVGDGLGEIFTRSEDVPKVGVQPFTGDPHPHHGKSEA
jgi:hypothetical protein